MTLLSCKWFSWRNHCIFRHRQKKCVYFLLWNLNSSQAIFLREVTIEISRPFARRRRRMRVVRYTRVTRLGKSHRHNRGNVSRIFAKDRIHGSDLASPPPSTILGTEAIYVDRKRRRGAASNLSSNRRPWANHWPRSPRPPPRSAECSRVAVVLSDPPDSADVFFAPFFFKSHDIVAARGTTIAIITTAL